MPVELALALPAGVVVVLPTPPEVTEPEVVPGTAGVVEAAVPVGTVSGTEVEEIETPPAPVLHCSVEAAAVTVMVETAPQEQVSASVAICDEGVSH